MMRSKLFSFFFIFFISLNAFTLDFKDFSFAIDGGTSLQKDGFSPALDISVFKTTTPVPTEWVRGMCDLTYFATYSVSPFKNNGQSFFQKSKLQAGAMISVFFFALGLEPSWHISQGRFTFDYFAGLQGGFLLSNRLGFRFQALFRSPIAIFDEYSFLARIGLYLHEPFKKRYGPILK